MSDVGHCALADLEARLGGEVDHLLMSVSYEERSLGIWQALRRTVRGEQFVCFNENHSDYLAQNIARIRKEGPGAKLLPLNSDQPLTTFDGLRRAVERLAGAGAGTIAIDITSFMREALCMLVYLLEKQLPRRSRVVCIYHKAESYGASRSGGWLSQGVMDVRSVLGFCGQGKLTGPTHLIVLPGYEVDRALEIIERLQPLRLSLGFVTATHSVSARFNEVLDAFVERLEAFYAGRAIERFEFSSIDPLATRDQVLETCRRGGAHENIAVACLNTKPATVGAALACVRRPATQMVYAQPVRYNTANYSKASNEVLFFELPLGNESATGSR